MLCYKSQSQSRQWVRIGILHTYEQIRIKQDVGKYCRNWVDIKLVNSEAKANELAAKLNYQHNHIFYDNLVVIHMKKIKLVLNKPVYLGMCILNLSKTLMYGFHYNYIKTECGPKAKFLFKDTDTLAYGIAKMTY